METTTPRGGHHDTTDDSISSLILSHKPGETQGETTGNHMETTVGSIPSLICSKKPVRGFPRHFPHCFRHFPIVSIVSPVVSLSFLLSFDRRDQELSKTFDGLKIGPLLRKLQAFKDWSFLGGFPCHFPRCFRCLPHHFRSFPVVSTIIW